MHNAAMAQGDVFTDDCIHTIGKMYHAAILDIGIWTYPDGPFITPNNCIWPDAAIFLDCHITDYDCGSMNIARIMYLGLHAPGYEIIDMNIANCRIGSGISNYITNIHRMREDAKAIEKLLIMWLLIQTR